MPSMTVGTPNGTFKSTDAVNNDIEAEAGNRSDLSGDKAGAFNVPELRPSVKDLEGDRQHGLIARLAQCLCSSLPLSLHRVKRAKEEVFLAKLSEKEQRVLRELSDWSVFAASSSSPSSAALTRLGAGFSFTDGLSSAQVESQKKRFGLNVLSSTKPRSPAVILVQALPNPFNFLLCALAIIAIATGDKPTSIILIAMVVLSVSLRYWQELRSEHQVQGLKDLIKAECTVMRDKGRRVTVLNRDIVPADIVLLTTGNVVPADCLVLDSQIFTVSQSSLTGESWPMEKYALCDHQSQVESCATCDSLSVLDKTPVASSCPPSSAFDAPNILFRGTYVVSGRATAVVIGTGDSTYIASMTAAVSSGKPTKTSFEAGIRKVSILLIAFMAVMVPIVLVIEGLVSQNWKKGGLFCLAVAVGLVPEMLPAISNGCLAGGAMQMAKLKAIVRRLDAIQSLGSSDVLCSDKTGTLTEDQFQVVNSFDPLGSQSLRPIALARVNASLQDGLANALDTALLNIPTDRFGSLDMYPGRRKVSEVPFDFIRRLLSVEVQLSTFPGRDYRLLITKGAVEELLAKCSRVRLPGAVEGQAEQVATLDDPLRLAILARVGNFQSQGLRVIGVATRPIDKYASPIADYATPLDEFDLTCEGFVAFLDSPKEDARESLARLTHLGVDTKVLTGDNLETAVRICRVLDIIKDREDERSVSISGPSFASLGEQQKVEVVERCKLFAKLTPIQKFEVVQLLKQTGKRVSFLGDGINDAPALRAADCGISVDSATDLAKDSADVILTRKSLSAITDGVLIGRRCQMNVAKYMFMAASSNFGNVFSVTVVACWLKFPPMAPVQLLTQNLLYDISQSTIPFDNVDEEQIEGPVSWDIKNLTRFMICFGSISSVLDIITFLFCFYYLGYNNESDQSEINKFNTAWFIVGSLTQGFVVHFLRTPKIPFLQSCASWPVIITSTLMASLAVAIPFSPLGHVESMELPPPIYAAYLFAAIVAYVCLVSLVKFTYLRAFKMWL